MSAFRIPLHWELQNHNLPACSCIMIQRGEKSTLKFFWNHVLHFSKVGSGIAIVIVKHYILQAASLQCASGSSLSLSLQSHSWWLEQNRSKWLQRVFCTPRWDSLLCTTSSYATARKRVVDLSLPAGLGYSFFPWKSINTSLGCWVDLSLCLLLGIQSAFFCPVLKSQHLAVLSQCCIPILCVENRIEREKC